jgi:hypothetical protein
MSYQRGYTALETTILVLFLLGAGGWVANIVKLVGMDFGVISGWMIARAIGIPLGPLGAVLGYL